MHLRAETVIETREAHNKGISGNKTRRHRMGRNGERARTLGQTTVG